MSSRKRSHIILRPHGCELQASCKLQANERRAVAWSGEHVVL
jgi:hypothetical protein